MLIKDTSIRDRFCSCLHEIPGTLKEKAERLKTNANYLSDLPKKKKPEIKGSILANFCQIYGYSPVYILLGEGPKKGISDDAVTSLFKEVLKEVKNRNKSDEIIHDLLQGMIELKAVWGNTTKHLVEKAKKYNKQ